MYCAIYDGDFYNINERPFSGDVLVKVLPFTKIRLFRSRSEFEGVVLSALCREEEWKNLKLQVPNTFSVLQKLIPIDYYKVEGMIEDMCLEVDYESD